jgi:NaMN:DMB phosphoribosyltransferase
MPKDAQELDVKTYAAQLDFSKSQIQGLADYEKGFVKEGVGMGGAVLYALNNGAKIEDITKRTEKLYIELTKK